MRSLSPENHPSSLPSDLAALDLTLLEVGGVESMIGREENREMLTQDLQEMLQEILQLVVLVEEISCNRFYSINRIKKHSMT